MSLSVKTFTGSIKALSSAAVLAAVSAFAVQPGAVQSGFVGTEPLYFEAHGTQNFVARGQDCSLYLGATEAVLLLSQSDSDRDAEKSSIWNKSSREVRTVRMSLVGASADGKMTGIQELAGKANYLIGNNSAEWRIGVPLFGKVQVNEVYPGIDVIYYADQSARFEYDFALKPGSNPDQISFRIEGADRVSIDANGDLVLKIGSDEIRQHRPVIYQNVAGGRKAVAGGYRMISENTIGFRVGGYDRALPLVIDPVLSFSTYLGGSKFDVAHGVGVDDANNIYVAGETLSKGLVPTGSVTLNFSGTNYLGGLGIFGDAFVAKYDATTHALVYLTYLGGKTDDSARAMAVMTNGNVLLTGFTDSADFPVLPIANALAQQTIANSGRSNNAARIFPINAYVTELDSAGSSIVMSTLVGGSRRETGTGIAFDDSGIYITGITESTNFPVVPAGAFTNYQARFGGNGEAFVSKIDWSGTSLLYSTFFGGTNLDFPQGIAVNNQEPFITGYTSSTNFPILNPIQLTDSFWTNGRTLNVLNMQSNRSTRLDAFVTHFGSDFTLKYSTFLGGTNDDSGAAIAVDPAGNAYVTGYTYSRVFPTNTIAAPRSTGSNYTSHIFLTKIAPEGSNVIYSVDFGSRGADRGTAIALNNGQVYITGTSTWTNTFATNSYADLRSTNAIARRGTVGQDIFVTGIQESPGGVAPLQFTNSAFLGGLGNDQPNGIAVRTVGTNVVVWLAGQTVSRDFVVTNDFDPSLVQTNLGGLKKGKLNDAFINEILFPIAP
jgi:hypothetical protein